MSIHSLALTQLVGGMAIATAQFEQGRTATAILEAFRPHLPAQDADPALNPAVEPLRRLYVVNGDRPGRPLGSRPEPEVVVRAFFEAARQLHDITEDRHPEIALWAGNAVQVWRRGLSYPPPLQETAVLAANDPQSDTQLIEWLRRFIEHSPEPMGVVECHADGSADLVMFNRRNRELWGLGENDLAGFSVENFFYPDDHRMVRGFIRECLASGSAIRTGVRMLRRSGGHLLVDMYVGRVEDSRYAYFQVINESQREQALGQNRIFEAVLRNAREPLALFKFDGEGHPTGILTSAGFNKMLGYEANEMDGKPVAEFIPGHLRGSFATRLGRFRKTGIFDWKEAELVTKDGRTVSVDIYAEASDVGGSQFAVATFNDAGARIAAERDAAEAQKLDIIASVTAGIAHDGNNIVTIILAGLELLYRRFPDDDFLPAMLDKAGMLTGMFSRFRQLTDTVEKAGGIDIHNILSEADIRLATRNSNDVEIDFDLEDAPWPVAGPPFAVWQIAFNIIKNAVESMEKSPVKRLTIRTENIEILDEVSLRRLDPAQRFSETQPGRFVKLSIEDTGGGIPPEILPRIFEDYFSTKNGGNVNRGRGLSTSYRAVGQRGGLLTVRTAQGRGTVFEIYLPRVDPESSRPEAGRAGHAILPDSRIVSPGGEVILVADDDPAIRNQYERILRFCRYDEVILVGTMDEILEVIRKRDDVTAIVMDWRMPGITGDELLRELNDLRPELPVLVNTGLIPAQSGHHPNVRFVQKMSGLTTIGLTLRRLIGGESLSGP